MSRERKFRIVFVEQLPEQLPDSDNDFFLFDTTSDMKRLFVLNLDLAGSELPSISLVAYMVAYASRES
jgi:hypothetical protein